MADVCRKIAQAPAGEDRSKAANTREDGAPHQLIESAWYFAALDDATEAKLSSIVRRVAS